MELAGALVVHGCISLLANMGPEAVEGALIRFERRGENTRLGIAAGVIARESGYRPNRLEIV